MDAKKIQAIFYVRSITKLENDEKARYLWITILFVFIVSVLLLFSGLKFRNSGPMTLSADEEQLRYSKFPSVPATLEQVRSLLQDVKYECQLWHMIPNAVLAVNEPQIPEENSWKGGTSLCLDPFPKDLNPSNCRIYSTSYNDLDVIFEKKMGLKGCRVHIWGNATDMNYSMVSKNVYFYPLDLGVASTFKAVYSYDDYLDLLGHKNKTIHLVKSEIPGGDSKLVKALMASSFQAVKNIRQIRMLVYLPKLSTDVWRNVEAIYSNLVALQRFGFQLAKSKTETKNEYFISGFDKPFSTIYEMVWIQERP